MNKAVIQQFMVRIFQHNRRGLGWDTLAIKGQSDVSIYAAATHRHQIFTSMAVGVTPTYELIPYLFIAHN